MNLLPGIFAASVAAVLASGCSNKPDDKFVSRPPETIPPATVTVANQSTLFPLDKGNQWTYTVNLRTRVNGQDQPVRTYESVWTVTESKQTPNGIEATIETSLPGQKKDVLKWRSNSKGIYQLADGNPPIAFDPPFPVIQFPVTDNASFKWKGIGPNGKQAVPQTSSRTVRPSEEVDTDMGRMSAIPVDDSGALSGKGSSGKSVSTEWFAPGVGIVRMRREVVVGDQGYVLLLKLKSKSLMKS